MIRSNTRPVITITSVVGMRPVPSARSSSRCDTTPRSEAASVEADLLLLERREEVDDPVDGLGGVGRVERRDHQVAGLGRGQGRPHRLGVAHLADEDHVWVLAQHPAHGRRVVGGVGADLSLVDERQLVGVQHLDRVLDRDDVDRARLVDVVDHGRHGRGLARTGRTGDQDHPPGLVGQPPYHGRQPERLERRCARKHPAKDQADRPALAEHVDAEATEARDAVGEVGLVAGFELVGPVLGHDRKGHPLGVCRGHEGERSRRQMTVDTDVWGRTDLDVEVGAALLHGETEQLVEIEHALNIGAGGPEIEPHSAISAECPTNGTALTGGTTAFGGQRCPNLRFRRERDQHDEGDGIGP